MVFMRETAFLSANDRMGGGTFIYDDMHMLENAASGVPPAQLENTCSELFQHGKLTFAQKFCRLAQEYSDEAWSLPFLTEAKILSEIARNYEKKDMIKDAASASALAVFRLRQAVAASPLDSLTDFQEVASVEYVGSNQIAKTFQSLRFGDLPGLKQQPIYPIKAVYGAAEIQASIGAIIVELNQVSTKLETFYQSGKSKKLFDNFIGWKPSGEYSEMHDSNLLVQGGNWTQLGLFSYGVRHKKNCEILFPHLCALIESLSRIRSCSVGHVVLSRLTKGSRIRRHRGAPNTRVTIQCPLELPTYNNHSRDGIGSRLVVGNTSVDYQIGRCFVFDDNIEHYVEVDSDNNGHSNSKKSNQIWRTVLIAHAWHPEVRPNEMLQSVAMSANMDPNSRESVLKHIYSLSAAEWRREALMLRGMARSKPEMSTVLAADTKSDDL